jgi:uncharacterized repeat protein (TIGR01451 family)
MRSILLITILVSAFSTHAQTWQWGRTMGNFNQQINGWQIVENDGLAADAYGNVYVSGTFYDTLRLKDTVFVSKVGTNHTRNQYIIKFSPAGDVVWAKIFPGSYGYGRPVRTSQLQLDSHGNIYFTGVSVTAGSFQGHSYNGFSFLCKLTPNGQISWVKGLGTWPGFTLDTSGNVYTVFTVLASTTFNYHGIAMSNTTSVCLGKMDTNGNGVWLKQFAAANSYDYNLMFVEVNPANNELLFSVQLGNNLTIGNTTYTTANPGIIGRFNTANGATTRIITAKASNSYFRLDASKWINDTTIALSINGFNGSNITYTIGSSVINTTYPGYFRHVFFTAIDTAGQVKWYNNNIYGGGTQGGWDDNLGYNIAVADSNIYLTGSLMTGGKINGEQIATTLGSMTFLARYGLDGTFKHYVTGGIEKCLSGGKYIASYGDKIYLSGSQVNYTNAFSRGVFGNDTTTSLGYAQTFVGRIDGSTNIVKGKVYIDFDNNGSYNAGDKLLPSVLLKSLPQNSIYVTNAIGNYTAGFGLTNYDISPFANFPQYCNPANPTNYSGSFTTYKNHMPGKDFRFVPLPDVNDLQIDITSIGATRPGFPASYFIWYSNKGNTTLSGQYSIKKDPYFNYLSSDSVLAATYGDSLVFNYNNLKPLESRRNYVSFVVSTSAIAGHTALMSSYIYPIANDSVPADNVDTVHSVITASFDPNSKEVSANSMKLVTAQSGTQYLEYTLNFQNTGTDTAFNVLVTDVLPPQLNLETLQLLSSTHNVELEINENNALSFYFRNIYLVDSNTNEPKSHGFVKFRIKPKTTVTLQDSLFNACSIYFDYNDPVITNTVNTYFTTDALPVTLNSFTAVKKDKSAFVEWVVSAETSLDKYELLWSSNGKDFEVKAVITAIGDTRYNYTDHTTVPGINYYRLQLVDKDGSRKLGKIAVVIFSANPGFSIAPNPAKDIIVITLADAAGTVVSVYDTQGRILMKKNVAVGTMQQLLDISTLRPGNYIIKLSLRTEEQAILIQKQ